MNSYRTLTATLLSMAIVALAGVGKGAEPLKHDTNKNEAARNALDNAAAGNWQEVFFDSGTENWQTKWFKDGEVATVENTPEGVVLRAGPEWGNGKHHMVLWTKDSFEGDLKIDFEYTRLDTAARGANILYVQASGSGDGAYKKDISEWKELRTTPAMSLYFNNMHTYHISYAAEPGTDREYIRARRYMPGGSGVAGLEITELEPDYFCGNLGLFKTGVPHRITVVKKAKGLFMRIKNGDGAHYFHWENDTFPPITAGRIGLRLMFSRAARYKDFRVHKSLSDSETAN